MKRKNRDPQYLYTGSRCTLDGHQAIIVAGQGEALVCQTPFGLKVPFAWETVDRIMKQGGKFKSDPALKMFALVNKLDDTIGKEVGQATAVGFLCIAEEVAAKMDHMKVGQEIKLSIPYLVLRRTQ